MDVSLSRLWTRRLFRSGALRALARVALVGGALFANTGLTTCEAQDTPWRTGPSSGRFAAGPSGTGYLPAQYAAPVTPSLSDDEDYVPPEAAIPAQIRALPDIQAKMKVVHRRSQLLVGKHNISRTAVADGGVVEVVQYSENELAIIGQGIGQTTVTLWFDDGSEPLIYLVEVIRDPSLDDQRRHDYGKLEKKLALMFPNSKVYLIPFSNKIIVKGQARDAEEAVRILDIIRGEVITQNGGLVGPQPGNGFGFGGGNFYDINGITAAGTSNNGYGSWSPMDQWSNNIVNMLEVPGEFQVAIRVRIAELNRSELKRMGVSFDFVVNEEAAQIASVLAGGASTVSGVFSAGDINVLVDALSANGHATLLAEPTLTVESGHPAAFISGGDFAVPTTVGVQGVGAIATQFRGYGVSLTVTPTILDKDLIRMQINPEFSELNSGAAVNGIPGTNLRRVSTTVKLREGQTIALAGLFSRQTRSEVARIPFLGEIPLIGPIAFANKRASADEKELLILVSPEIVRAMEPDEVPPMPGYEVTQPNDKEFFLHGMTAGAPDQRVHQLAPYGHANGRGIEVGYSQYNPPPAEPGYHPKPTNPTGAMGGGQVPFGPGMHTGPGQSFGPGPTPVPPGAMPPGPMGARPGMAPVRNQQLQQTPPRGQMGPSASRGGGRGYTIPTGGGAVPAGYYQPRGR
jgi:pilus assembly protein CpaC